jgi:hypothetical protein
MADTPTTDPTPTNPQPWYQSPLVKYLAGVLLTVAITLLSAKLGVSPQPVPTLPQSVPGVLVLNVSPAPATAQPISVAGK